MVTGCIGGTRSTTNPAYPATGLVLLSLKDGSRVAAASLGSDPVAVIVSQDGGTAYVADSSPGDIYAVGLPHLKVSWKRHLGRAPFGLLLHSGRLFVSLYTGAVVELAPSTGALLASHPLPQGPAEMSVDAAGRVVVAGTRGQVYHLDGSAVRAGNGFGIAVVHGRVWTADYERAELVSAGDGHRVGMPLPVFPFWLAAGAGNTLLITAEGDTEDTALGGVFSYDTATGTFRTLARPRDPDQVVQSGLKVLVAAHGDREVLAIEGGQSSVWARGAAAVAIAPDPSLNLLVLVVNAHE